MDLAGSREPDHHHPRSDRPASTTEQEDTLTSTAWNTTCAQVAAWYAQHGQAPSIQSTNPAEKKLAQWVRTQRQQRKGGRLSPDRAAQLESIPGWTWTAR